MFAIELGIETFSPDNIFYIMRFKQNLDFGFELLVPQLS